jgi:LysR family transcriptional regulator, hydrogen peroxide-inducible genes activator
MTPLPSPQQLRYLTALAESRHFGRAALACAVTQSTLSAGILTLERQLDAAILDRSAGKHVVFTPLGLELVGRAATALAALEAVTDTATAARTPMSGPLRLGVIPTIGPFLLPRLMPALREGFPQLRLQLQEDTTTRLVERLDANKLDVLLLALPCECGGSDVQAVARDEFLVALPKGHRLAAQARVPVAALAGERLLLLEDGHCLRDQALAFCATAARRGASGTGSTVFGASSLTTVMQMVAGGYGVTLIPQIAADVEKRDERVKFLRLENPQPGRSIGLAFRRTSPRKADFAALGEVVRESMDSRSTTASLRPIGSSQRRKIKKGG